MSRLLSEYQSLNGVLESFRGELVLQLQALLAGDSIETAVPIESRVKAWASIQDKCARTGLEPKSVAEVPDLVGLRVILLFRRDVRRVCSLLDSHLLVHETEEVESRLAPDQFGYSSTHYIVEAPANWLGVPTLAGFGGLRAEIQVRTASQHIWAAASHLLQYKNEQDVPSPIRRSINRVSALLETVDLEFERVLEERGSYMSEVVEDGELNTDSLRRLLEAHLPSENRGDRESYSELLGELRTFGVESLADAESLVVRHLASALESEREQVELRSYPLDPDDDRDRAARGVYFTHTGLAREMMRAAFGSDYEQYLGKQYGFSIEIDDSADPERDA